MKRKTSNLPTKIYSYGAFKATINADLVEEQYRNAHRYRNKLVEIEIERRQKYRAMLSEYTQVSELETVINPMKARLEELRSVIKNSKSHSAKIADISSEKKEVATLKLELKELYAKLKEAKALLKNDPAIKERSDKIYRDSRKSIAAARAVCNCYWGSYLMVEAAAEQMRRSVEDPRFVKWGPGNGRIGVQIMKGMPVSKVHGDHSFFQIDPIDWQRWHHSTRGERRKLGRTKARIRIGSEGIKPIWAEFPMVMHRPLPADGTVKNAWVHRVKLGVDYVYSLQVVVEAASFIPAEHAVNIACGIDVGWRIVPKGIRVAFAVGADGAEEEIVLDQSVKSRVEKSQSLQSVRDKNFNNFHKPFSEWFKDQTELPEQLAVNQPHIEKWRSPERLSSFVEVWAKNRFSDDEAMFEIAQEWYKQERHLHQWEDHGLDNAHAHRRDYYRNVAHRLCTKYSTIYIEEFDLREFSKKTLPEEGEDTAAYTREVKNIAAVSYFRQILASAASASGTRIVKVSAVNTTRFCSYCGHLNEAWDASKELLHQCDSCSKIWDIDKNASRNILFNGQKLDQESASQTA